MTEPTPIPPQVYKTVHDKEMHYAPGSVVATTDAMYLVQNAGNWMKFAERGKRGWKLLKMNQTLLDHALREMERLEALRADAIAKAEAALKAGDFDEAAKVIEETVKAESSAMIPAVDPTPGVGAATETEAA